MIKPWKKQRGRTLDLSTCVISAGRRRRILAMRYRFHNLKPYLSRIRSQSAIKSSLDDVTLHLRQPYYLLQHCPNQYAIPRRWHLGHSHSQDDHHQRHDLHLTGGKEAENIFRLGLAADVCLSAGKAVAGYLSGSTALIADAAHSVSDVVLSGIALLSFKAAKVPKDQDHPYGHGKFETLGALGISCVLLGTAGGIGWHAVDLLLGILSSGPEIVNHSLTHELGHGIDMDHPILALSMTIISISTKEGLYWITKRAGEKRGSALMKANAWHHRADAISSFVALIGVGGSLLGVHFLDPLAGLVVSGMILKVGIQTGYQSVLELVDAAIPAEHLEPIRETILQVEDVKGCHRLRGRRAGSSLYLDVHIEVNPFLSVSAAHGLGETVRHQIHKSHPQVTEVFIHIDPSTSDFCSVDDQQELGQGDSIYKSLTTSMSHKEIEDIVFKSLSSKFAEEMAVERITQHLLQGKILLDVEVSMQPDMLIREAMEVAREAEEEMMKGVPSPSNFEVRFQLRLRNIDPPIA